MRHHPTPSQTQPDAALAQVVQRLVEAYQPERIYLFGSQARGQAGPHSDYDLLVIVPDDAPPERRRSRLAYQVLRGTGIAADVLVWPPLGLRSAAAPARLPAGDGSAGGEATVCSLIRSGSPIPGRGW